MKHSDVFKLAALSMATINSEANTGFGNIQSCTKLLDLDGI